MGLQGVEQGIEGTRLEAEHLVGARPQGLDHLIAVHVPALQQGQQQHAHAARSGAVICHIPHLIDRLSMYSIDRLSTYVKEIFNRAGMGVRSRRQKAAPSDRRGLCHCFRRGG